VGLIRRNTIDGAGMVAIEAVPPLLDRGYIGQ
jgi:hypothetical protein